tara:strand:- start:1669 stop:1821 length:153 start_codon:yes stop_codon:yes gene_type:complete
LTSRSLRTASDLLIGQKLEGAQTRNVEIGDYLLASRCSARNQMLSILPSN